MAGDLILLLGKFYSCGRLLHVVGEHLNQEVLALGVVKDMPGLRCFSFHAALVYNIKLGKLV